MSTLVIFTRELTNAILNISYQLEKANELRAEELEIRKKELELKGAII